MARNLRKYGYGPNQTNYAPFHIVHTAAQNAASRAVGRRRTPEQQRAAIEPMQLGERVWAYMRQNTPGHNVPRNVKATLTPRQLRRLRHKSKLGGTAWRAGVRP